MKKKSQRNNKLFGYHPSTMSLFKSGERPLSYPLAVKIFEYFQDNFHKEFSCKTINEWKNADKDLAKKVLTYLSDQEAAA